MYSERMRTLLRAYSSAEKNNKLYLDAKRDNIIQQAQVDFLFGLQNQLRGFDLAVTQKESEWRDAVLIALESEIVKDLAYVFPEDGYTVSLSTRVLRGKIHIEATVSSIFSGDMPGRIRGTQGRIFQQVVSFAALIGVMELLGIKTAYIDEAFSGSSKQNIKKLNKLLESLREREFNLIMIAQDTSIANGLDVNCLYLSRSLDNKTLINIGGRTNGG